MKHIASIVSLLLCAVTAQKILEPNSDEVTFNSPMNNWRNEYKRAPHPKRELNARSPENLGKAPFVVYMCRDTAQQDCDPVWVSTGSYCFDNQHWFGWTTTNQTPKSVKIVGKTCCAFYGDQTCNKMGNHLGWQTKVCEGDTGNAAILSGVPQGYMCNVPYDSAGTAMSTYGTNVVPVPSTAAQIATVKP